MIPMYRPIHEEILSANPGPTTRLIDHLRRHAVRTDGPFTLRSGEVSGWYIDARQTTFSGEGAVAAGAAVLEALPSEVEAVGGMTMGADPIAIATVVVASGRGVKLRAFSVRKSEKSHGTGGRLVGPVAHGDRVVVLDDTVTTGGALMEAITEARRGGLVVVAALALVDRSGGAVADRLRSDGIPYRCLVTPVDLGVE